MLDDFDSVPTTRPAASSGVASKPSVPKNMLDDFDSVPTTRPAASSVGSNKFEHSSADTFSGRVAPVNPFGPSPSKSYALPITLDRSIAKSEMVDTIPGFLTPSRGAVGDSSSSIGKADSMKVAVNPFSSKARIGFDGSEDNVEQRVREFYAKYNPAKLSEVTLILAKYKGKESELLSKLQKQYHVSSL